MTALGWLRALFWRPLIDVDALPPLPRRPKKPRVARKRHITDTLNELELTFANVRRADESATTDHSLRAALRALGPYFPPPSLDAVDHLDASIAIENLPSLVFVAANGSNRERVGDFVECDFIYANKLTHLPWNVQQLDGVALYECGGAWHDGERGLVWRHFHAAIDANRNITVARVLTQISQRIGHGRRCDYIVRMSWRLPEWFDHTQMREHMGPGLLADAINFWTSRDAYWQVSARRDGSRVTFCIPDNEAKHYFKDRDANALTPNGQRKRIIHYVRDHLRVTGAEVRAHIRGLRQFDWNGFYCSVVAPRFHLSIATTMSMPATPGDHLEKNVSCIHPERFAEAIADADDEQTLDPLRAVRRSARPSTFYG